MRLAKLDLMANQEGFEKLLRCLLAMESAGKIIVRLSRCENLGGGKVSFCLVEPLPNKVPDDLFTASHR